MTIRFHCPAGHRLSVDESRAGRKVRCPRCKQIVQVPEVTESAKSRQPPEGKAKRPPLPPREPADKAEVDGSGAEARPKESAGSKPPPRKPRKRGSKPKPSDSPGPAPKPPPLPSARKPARPKPKPKPKREPETKAEPGPKSAKQDASSRRKRRRDRRRSRRKKSQAVSASAPKAAEQAPKPAEKTSPQPPEQTRVRKKKLKQPKTMPPDVYQADEGKILTVKYLAIVLVLAALFSVVPVAWKLQLNLETAPGWARVVVLIAALQLLYVAWMLAAPDWAAVWVVMLVFAGVSTIYGTATAYVVASPADKPMLLELGDVRHAAASWCGAVLAVTALATYLCGRTSARWRRSFELETAGRRRKSG